MLVTTSTNDQDVNKGNNSRGTESSITSVIHKRGDIMV
jgi:hypothetical protein